MSEFKGTPGSWKVKRYNGEAVGVEYNWAPGLKSGICVMGCGTSRTTTLDEEEANANLIAAAPDLLEALQEADRLLKSEWGVLPKNSNGYILIQKIKAAIAKALGTT